MVRKEKTEKGVRAVEQKELYQQLDLPEEVVAALSDYAEKRTGRFPFDLGGLIGEAAVWKGLEGKIKEFVGEDPDGIGMLWEDLEIARNVSEEYKKRGIPAEIFVDTMKFCTRFLNEYHKTYGTYRFVWGWWFPRQLSMREFRIGALEYEYCDDHMDIHIPSDADLSRASVLDSLTKYREFCRKYYPKWGGLALCCGSWLLSPALHKLLDENSNILQFQNMFDVTETDEESMGVLDWVFPGNKNVSEQLPEKTSLQRNMKQYLLSGGKIGWSKGVLRRTFYEPPEKD